MTDYLEFARRGRTAWWRYPLTLIAAFFFAVLIMTVLLVSLMLFHRLPPDIAAQLKQPQNSAVFFVGIAVTFGAFAGGLLAAAALVQRKSLRDIIGRWRWSLFFGGAALWLAVQSLLALVDFAIAPHGFSLTASAGTLSLAFWAFAGLLIQTLAEELIFRGYLTQGLLLALKKPLPTAIVSGLLFGALHIMNGAPQAINASIFGIVCSLVAIRMGGIALTSGLHLVNNYFGAVLVVSADDVFRGSPGFFTQNTPQLMWWDLSLAIVVLLGFAWAVLQTNLFQPAPES